MSPDGNLSLEEARIIDELCEKVPPLHDLNRGRIGVEKRWPDQIYLEFNYEGVVPIDHHAYDEEILADDVDGSPLGIAIFYSDTFPLSKMQVFRYDGEGDVHVVPGSIRLFA